MVRLKLQRTHHVPFPVDHQLLYKSSHQDQAHPRKNPAALRTAAPPWDGRPRALHPGLVVTVALVTATVGHTWHTHVFAPNGMVITFQNIFKTTAVTTFPELRIKRALREESNSGSSSSEQSHECRQVNHSEDSCPRRAPAWAAARTPHLCPLSGSPMETARTGEAGERAGRPVHPPPSTSTSQTNDLSWGPSTGRQGENKSREVVKMGTVGILDPSLFWASVQDQGRAAIQHHSLRSDWCPRRPQPQHPHLFPAPKTPRQVTREHFSYQHPHVYINSEHVLAAEQREGGGPEDTARGGKTASQDTGGGGGQDALAAKATPGQPRKLRLCGRKSPCFSHAQGEPGSSQRAWGWPLPPHPRAYLHPDGLVRHAAHHVADGSEQLQQGLHEVSLPFVFIQSAKEHRTLDGAWWTGPHACLPPHHSRASCCWGGNWEHERKSATSMEHRRQLRNGVHLGHTARGLGPQAEEADF